MSPDKQGLSYLKWNDLCQCDIIMWYGWIVYLFAWEVVEAFPCFHFLQIACGEVCLFSSLSI